MADHPRRHIQQWTDQHIEQLCALLAAGNTFRDTAIAMGTTLKSISGKVNSMKAKSDMRLPEIRPKGGIAAAPVPDDFIKVATGRTNPQLMEHYHTGLHTITKWRKLSGVPASLRAFYEKPIPPYFATIAPTLLVTEAAAQFGIGKDMARRWAARTGVEFTRLRGPGRGRRLKMDRDDTRDMSRSGQAADYLRRLGPVFRCKEDGTPSTKGTHWRRGRYVLTNEEIIDRAQRNGWQPDGWRELRGSTPTITNGERA